MPREHRIGHTLEGLAEHDESSVRRVDGTQVQIRKPASATAVSPFCGKYHQIQRVSALDLQPRRAARARIVRRVQCFHHHPFMSAIERVVVEGLCGGDFAGDQAGDQQFARQRRAHRLEARGGRCRHQILIVAAQAVEEEYRQRHGSAHRVNVEDAPETAHRILKRVGRAPGLEHDGLAVEDQRLRARALDSGYDLGSGGRHVVAGARIDAHVLSAFVCLHAGAVELPLERRHGNACHRVGDVIGRLRQHRGEWLKERDRVAAQTGRAVGQCARCHGGNSAGDHRRPAHCLRGHASSRGDSFDHEPVERTLAQLAQQQARQKFPFARHGSCEKRAQEAAAFGDRTATAGSSDLFERRVDFREGEGGRFDIRDGLALPGVANHGPTDAAASLARCAREKRHANVDLCRREPAQEFRDACDLRAPRGVLADTLRCVDERGEQSGGYGLAARRITVNRTLTNEARSALIRRRVCERPSAVLASRWAMF